jgi:large subunit ribosomal protein L23
MKEIFKGSLVSEKTSNQAAQNKYVLWVNPDANKIEIKKFVEAQFDVKVKGVNVLNQKGKKRRRGRIEGKTKDRKKAVITLAKAEDLEKMKVV